MENVLLPRKTHSENVQRKKKLAHFLCFRLLSSSGIAVIIAKEASEMLYLKRKIDAFLAKWKADPDRKPLIVKGPRQVGKTESIKRFGDMNYQSVITINFVEEPKYKTITADGYKADDIIKNTRQPGCVRRIRAVPIY